MIYGQAFQGMELRMANRRTAFTLIELFVVVFILALVISILLPSLSTARKKAIRAKLSSESSLYDEPRPASDKPGPSTRPLPQAVVKSIKANIELLPKLSVGTATPESIYEAKFNATLDALYPNGDGLCEVVLPLPPQIISLADLSISAGPERTTDVLIRDGRLVWRGRLPGERTPMQVVYTAVGKGLYSLEVPPGSIVELFDINLKAVGSTVRMLELSLQPTSYSASSYAWSYKNLMFGRPIALDVLGVAPIDRLGDLTWLGPISVAAFGLLVGLVAKALRLERIDRWMLLLIIGAFTGAYPMMYFAQEFIALSTALWVSAGVAIAIIAIRTMTITRPGAALFGFILPAIAMLAMTLTAVLQPQLQGLLLTGGAFALFLVAMLLMPHIKPANVNQSL